MSTTTNATSSTSSVLAPASSAQDDSFEVSEESLAKAESYIEEEEGAANKFTGWRAAMVTLMCIGMSLFHLYAAYSIVPTQIMRPVHVAMVLFLCFLMFPISAKFRHKIMWWDWIAATLSVLIVAYMIQGGDDFADRNTMPETLDIFFGLCLIFLVMEAMRRTNGVIMPIITSLFIVYALVGPYLPAPWTHKGYDVGRLVGVMYMTLEGIFGVAIDVSSSLIILFTDGQACACKFS